jgi:oxygen-independent coproporphyrinogen-3 oxidase
MPMATTSNTIASEDLSGEFMLNALRLTEGVPLTRFEAATGLPLDTLEPLRSTQIERGLLREDRLAATERGYAVLDSLIQDYL